MLSSGMTSVTFRKLTVLEIIDLVARAGLDSIEWGGDIHCPAGDPASAAKIGKLTRDAGLQVSAYGSYYRAGAYGSDFLPEFQKVLESAKALKAPLIRLWAGDKGSAETDSARRLAIAEETRILADLAQKEGIRLAFEYHGGTLTDCQKSAEAFYHEIHHPNVSAYWQPAVGISHEERMESLKAMAPFLANVHVFHWEGHDRLPLEAGISDWEDYLDYLAKLPGDHVLTMEFVQDDLPEHFLRDGAVLQNLLAKY